MPILKHKAFAYITHEDHLLVFRHPHIPGAGIQVPAGTVRPRERPEDAVLREAWEESGGTDLALMSFLGTHERDMADCGLDEIHHRHIYHLRCAGDPPSTWQHYERDPSDGSIAPILFEFFWARLPDGVPPLIADHDKLIPALLAHLTGKGRRSPVERGRCHGAPR